MVEKRFTIVPTGEVRLLVPWDGSEGFWHEDYAREKADMLAAAATHIREIYYALLTRGSSRYFRRKLFSPREYEFQCDINAISIRMAWLDVPLAVDKPGTQFMEVQGDILILRFPDMNEIMQFLQDLSRELDGMSLELTQKEDSIYYDLRVKATLRLQ